MTQNNSEEPGRDLIKVLLAEGVISQAQADLAARDAENMSMGLDDVLLARRWVTEETLQRLAPWLFGGAGAGAGGVGSGSGGAGAGGSTASAGASDSKNNGGAAGSTSASDSNTGTAGAASSGATGTSGSAGTAGVGSGSGAGRTSGAGIGRASASGMKAADKDSQGAEAEGLKEMKGSSDDYGENLARYRSIVRQILGNEG